MTVMPSKHSTRTTTVSVRFTVIGTFHVFIFMLYRYRYTVVCLYNIMSLHMAKKKDKSTGNGFGKKMEELKQ